MLPVGNIGGGEVAISKNLSYIIGGVFFVYSTFIFYVILFNKSDNSSK